MLASLRNLFGQSPSPDIFRAVHGRRGSPLYGARPFGMFTGLTDGMHAGDAIHAANWVKTLNSGTISTLDGHPATIEIATNNVGDAVTSMQLSKDFGTTTWKAFQMSSTDSIWFRFRLKLASAINGGLLVGLSNVATANIFGTGGSTGLIGAGITDFVGFHKPHGSATLNGVVRKASTSTSQTLTGSALVDDTYTILDIVIPDGTKEVLFFVNDARVYTQTTITNFPLTATQLTATVAAQTDTTTARTLTLNRPVMWQEAAA